MSGRLRRTLERWGLMRPAAGGVRMLSPYAGANVGRLGGDWLPSVLSADIETRGALTLLRARSRELVRNNDYAQRIIALLKQNVIGPQGILLQSRIPQEQDVLAEQTNEEIERKWKRWSCKENASVDGQMSWVDVQNLAIETLATDGEVFLRKVRNFPGNPFRYAVQFIDADRVDTNLMREYRVMADGSVINLVRMGIELDEWRRPVAYYILDRHPSEGGVGRWEMVPAADIVHLHMFKRVNQTRSVPFLHTAMARMHMLGQYEEAELVASRVAACMMGFITSKTGEEYTGGVLNKDGAKEITLAPGTFDQLPEGCNVATFNPQHPNQNYPEFTKRMLHGAAVGAGVAYSSLTGDLRDVNYSSIRQGILDERDGYRMLQAFVGEHLCAPVFRAWLDLAILSRQLLIPTPGSPDAYEQLYEAIEWQPRGWTWVDPLKDVAASMDALGAGITTLAQVCAERGLDWKDVLKQRKAELDYAQELGLNLSMQGISTTAAGAQDFAAPSGDPNADPNAPQNDNQKARLLAQESDPA